MSSSVFNNGRGRYEGAAGVLFSYAFDDLLLSFILFTNKVLQIHVQDKSLITEKEVRE
jgi:hypothetical protein